MPGALVPAVIADSARGVDNGNAFVVALIDELADMGQSIPGFFAAGCTPFLD